MISQQIQALENSDIQSDIVERYSFFGSKVITHRVVVHSSVGQIRELDARSDTVKLSSARDNNQEEASRIMDTFGTSNLTDMVGARQPIEFQVYGLWSHSSFDSYGALETSNKFNLKHQALTRIINHPSCQQKCESRVKSNGLNLKVQFSSIQVEFKLCSAVH